MGNIASYARVTQKKNMLLFLLLCDTETAKDEIPHTNHVLRYSVPGTRYLVYASYSYSSSTQYCHRHARRILQQYLERVRSKQKVSVEPPQHRPARAASARARPFRSLKRAATAPRCRACSASRGNRVGSTIVGAKEGLAATALGGVVYELPSESSSFVHSSFSC